MNTRRLVVAAVLLLLGVVAVVAWPKPARSPEDEIRALIASIADAAGKRDIAGVTDAFPDSFRAGNGMSGQDLRRYIAGLLLRSQKGVAVLNPKLEVTIEAPTSGAIKGTFIFAQDGTDIGTYDISARLTKTDGSWKFVSAEWNR